MLLFFIIGLAVIGLGIFAIVHSRRMNKLGKIRARVQNCIETYMQIGPESVKCYEVTFEVPTAYGVTYVTTKDNQQYDIDDYVDVFYDESRGTVEFPKNVSTNDIKGPLILIGFGILWCALCILGEYVGNADEDDRFQRTTKEEKQTTGLELNKYGYTNKHIEMSSSEKYSEYFYMPDEGENEYAYNIKIYHSGIGVVTLFPLETTGKAFNQMFTFYVDEGALKEAVNDTEKYRFEDLSTEKSTEKICYYLYYYDGVERVGAGGYIVRSSLYKKIADHIEACVPKNVWDAIEKEMERYFN